MKRLVIAVVAALSLLAGTGAASLAVPPPTSIIEAACEFASKTAQGADSTCRYEIPNSPE